jgi:hypothetical protein
VERVEKMDNERKIPFWDFYVDGVTQSCLRKFLQCKQQFYLEYVLGWSSDNEAVWFTYGKAFHYILEQAYKQTTVPKHTEILEWLANYRKLIAEERDRPLPKAKLEQLEVIYKIIETIAPIYFSYYAQQDFGDNIIVVDTERKFKIPYGDTYLNGCIDRVFAFKNTGELFINDHKCLSVISDDDISVMMPYDPQVQIYTLAAEQIYGKMPRTFKLNIIRRPRDFPKKGQTLTDYCLKIFKDVTGDFEHWFKRIPYTIDITEVQWYRENVLRPIVRDMKIWVDNGYTPRYPNPESLMSKYGRCSMFQMITSPNDAGYYLRKHVFQELV